MGEIREQGCIIRGVAGKKHPVFDLFQILLKDLFKQDARHGLLVIIAEPAVDMNGADFGRSACFNKDLDDPVDFFIGKARDIFTKVDGQIRDAILLIRGNAASGNFP